MTIFINNEDQAITDMNTVMEELEEMEVSEAIRRACRVDISDLINGEV